MVTSMESFFRTFEQLSAASNAADLAGLYAPSFLMAGPNGSQLVRATDLQHAIPKRKALFERLGCTSTHLASLEETGLDARYSLVRTEWRWRFERSPEAPVEFTLPSSFVIERSAGSLADRRVYPARRRDDGTPAERTAGRRCMK